ncbi:MAG: hypothetical protein ACFFFK_09555 [Candidatus Thorarchaeota archaeon]
MRNYNTGISSKVMASVLAAVILTAGVYAIAVYFPGMEPNTPGPTALGAQTAAFLNSMRDNVVCYFIGNSTFANEDLSDYYALAHPGAYVDGVRMDKNATGGSIEILFAPWSDYLVGSGSISTAEWNSLSGLIIDEGIGKMEAPEAPPAGPFPLNWPPTLYFSLYFNDNTCFTAGFSELDGFVWVENGTWTGAFEENGWPMISSWDGGYWLVEGGHLAAGMNALFTSITSHVSYPE